MSSISDYHAGKVLLKQVCAEHGLTPHKGKAMADKAVNYVFKANVVQEYVADIYLTSRMTVEEYLVFNKQREEEDLHQRPLSDGERKRVMEFINLQPA